MGSELPYPAALRGWLHDEPALLSAWRPVDVDEGTLFRAGSVVTDLYFVETGCLRLLFFNEDKEVTVHFYAEGDKITSPTSFFHQTPSLYGVEALEPCRLWRLSKRDFDRLGEARSRLETLLGAYVSDRCEVNGRRVMVLLSESPERRFLRFQREHPDLLGRVKQHVVASYLGITPVSLSRLRARLVRKVSRAREPSLIVG